MDMNNMTPETSEEPILAMAFVAFQPLNRVYEPEQGFFEGTLFPSLNKPFWKEAERR